MVKSSGEVSPRERSALLVEHGVVSGSEGAKRLGAWLGDERRRRGLRQDEAAAEIGVSASILGTWETGAGVPGEASMAKLRTWLGPQGWKTMIELVEYRAGSLGEARRGKGLPERDAAAESVPVKRGKAAREVTPDDVLASVMACTALGDRGRALLCAAVVALSAGVGVEVEIRARA